MAEFFRDLFQADNVFLRQALYAGLLASVACGVVGSFVVVRRITYIAGAISHTVLAGIGLAVWLQVVHGLAWASPLAGALVAGLASAFIIGYISEKGGERDDTVIGALWAIGMAVGVLFLHITPTYTDLTSYLFGNILLISQGDLILVAALDVLVIGLAIWFYKEFTAICFDPEFARVRGLPQALLNYGLLTMTAITVVLLVNLVGIVLMLALITLPAAIAGHYARSLWQMMLGGAGLATVFTTLGLALSYPLDLPAGPVIILVTGTVYLLQVGVRQIFGR